MRRAFNFFLLILIAVLLAGIYGTIHNQLSYTVSSEYFGKFKFRQFGLVDLALPGRVKASWVGWLASWWMGIPIGLIAGASGFMYREPCMMFRQTLKAYWVVVACTLVVGLLGLLYGVLETRTMDLAGYQHWYLPEDVVHLRRFLCAGYMHNSSYLGGLLGIAAAWLYQGIAKHRLRSSVA